MSRWYIAFVTRCPSRARRRAGPPTCARHRIFTVLRQRCIPLSSITSSKRDRRGCNGRVQFKWPVPRARCRASPIKLARIIPARRRMEARGFSDRTRVSRRGSSNIHSRGKGRAERRQKKRRGLEGLTSAMFYLASERNHIGSLINNPHNAGSTASRLREITKETDYRREWESYIHVMTIFV